MIPEWLGALASTPGVRVRAGSGASEDEIALAEAELGVLSPPIPGAVTGISTMPPLRRLPRPELLMREIAPRNPGVKSVSDAFDDPSIASERVTALPRVRRQQRLDPRPFARP